MLSVEDIKKILPHREPFLMIDRVDELVPGVSAKGVRAVNANEWFFQGHFGDYKVMPGVLIVEAIAQMGGIALLSSEEMKGKIAFLGRIKNARFKDKVVPGDVLQIETQLDEIRSGIGKGSGKAYVDGKLVASGEIVFAIGDAPATQ